GAELADPVAGLGLEVALGAAEIRALLADLWGGEEATDGGRPVLLRRLGLLDAPDHHVVVIDRHPGVATGLLGEDAGSVEGVEGEEEVADAIAVGVVLRRAVGAVGHAAVELAHF